MTRAAVEAAIVAQVRNYTAGVYQPLLAAFRDGPPMERIPVADVEAAQRELLSLLDALYARLAALEAVARVAAADWEIGEPMSPELADVVEAWMNAYPPVALAQVAPGEGGES